MSDLTTKLSTTITAMKGGKALVAGTGESRQITYAGGSQPVTSDEATIYLTDIVTGEQIQVGAGDATGITPTYCFTYAGKVYVLAGSSVFFSEVDTPTSFNDPDGVGNGFVSMANQFQTPENLVAMGPFQGRLAFFSRQTAQIWSVAADPANWAMEQVLPNVGVLAKDSLKAKGDLDLLFLSDTGVRSLRARESVLNAEVDDIGSPIDALIQTQILAYPSDAVNACAIVEPSSGRYWLFLKDTIYVLSYFRSAKVAAWSTYEPKDSAGATFTPTKFVVRNGQVYVRAGNKIYRYGGSDNNTYDTTVATWELPWFDLKSPDTMKSALGVNVAYSGSWSIEVGMDPVSGTLEPVAWSGSAHTYDKGVVPVSTVGTHFRAKGTSSGTGAAVFSSLVFHYQQNEEV